MLNLMSINLPIFLTSIRLVLSPTILPLIFVIFLPLNIFSINILVAIFFIILSLTDFFDGYLARSYNQITNLGKLLDPVADKFLLYSSLLSLVYINKLYFYWAIIFIGREFFVMGLREIALLNGHIISVSRAAKYKTALQFSYITMVILSVNTMDNNLCFCIISFLENILLLGALVLSIYSAFEYYQDLIRKLN